MEQNSKKSDMSRLKEIITILFKYKIQKGIDPVKLRLILEALGPTYVKIGQIMSTRADIFSKRYTDELVKLREKVNPLSFSVIEEQLNQTYGNYQEVFEKVETESLGSASIAQVHAAYLKNGQKVVLKIKRPGIYEQMADDVRLLKKAVKLLNIADVGNGVVDFNTVLDEFWQTAQEEMDFNIEANHAVRFKKQYADALYISAPTIYKEYSNKNILCMEYIGGLEVDETDKLDEAGYDRKEIADKLSYNYLSQIVKNGYFHADPHSGNIRIENDQIVWIDFGMMSTLTASDKELMKSGIKAIATENTTLLVDTILALGDVKKEVDYSALSMDMERFMHAYLSTDLQDIDIVEMVSQIFEICHKYAIMLPKGISMLARSLMTIEGTLLSLYPGLNIMQLLSAHIQDFTQADIKKELQKTALKAQEAAGSMLNIPVQTSELLKMLQHGQMKINLDVSNFDVIQANVNRMVNRIVVCMLDAALLLGSSVICTTHMKPEFLGIPLIGFFGFLFSLGLSLWLFFKMLFIHNKNKPF